MGPDSKAARELPPWRLEGQLHAQGDRVRTQGSGQSRLSGRLGTGEPGGVSQGSAGHTDGRREPHDDYHAETA